MRWISLFSLVLCWVMSPFALAEVQSEAATLDQLLEQIKSEQIKEREENKKREQRFLQTKQQQEQLLKKARNAHFQAQKGSKPLKDATEANKKQIDSLKTKLKEQSQDLGDLHAAFEEFAGDVSATLKQSLITAELAERSKELTRLSELKTMPTIDDLESLWFLMQEEMTESGKLKLFQTDLIDTGGKSSLSDVIRVGPFTSITETGEFLRFVPETGELLELNRQPSRRFQDTAREFANGPVGTIRAMVVDPTQGGLLSMMTYTPTIRERVDQAGTIGLIIILIGCLGLLITLWRVLFLTWISMGVSLQMKKLHQPKENNPLGRVLRQALQVKVTSLENLQFKLDEAVLAELPRLERGQGFIKLLAAVAPLLGLLGTVTGMILTFQSISLFGNGDPKLMANGISQALMTTVLGLVVAIPLLFGHNFVSALSRGLIQRLDEQSAGLLARSVEIKKAKKDV